MWLSSRDEPSHVVSSRDWQRLLLYRWDEIGQTGVLSDKRREIVAFGHPVLVSRLDYCGFQIRVDACLNRHTYSLIWASWSTR